MHKYKVIIGITMIVISVIFVINTITQDPYFYACLGKDWVIYAGVPCHLDSVFNHLQFMLFFAPLGIGISLLIFGLKSISIASGKTEK